MAPVRYVELSNSRTTTRIHRNSVMSELSRLEANSGCITLAIIWPVSHTVMKLLYSISAAETQEQGDLTEIHNYNNDNFKHLAQH